jgi:transposase
VNRKSALPIPEAILQLQRQLEQFRSTRPKRTKLPEPLWQAAVELARQHGVYPVAHPLRLDYMQLKKRLGGPATRHRKAPKPGIRRVGRGPLGTVGGLRHRVRVLRRREDAHPVEGSCTTRLGELVSRLAGCRAMIQITAQMRVLVAIESVDGRKGIDSLVRLCQRKALRGSIFRLHSHFRSRSGTATRLLTYDGQGYWLAQKRLSKGRFVWWPEAGEATKSLEAYEAQLLMVAGDLSRVRAAPMWRRVNAPK